MTEKMSDTIRKRLKNAGKSFKCNDNISDFVSEEELLMLQKEVEHSFQDIFNSLVIDTENDHNTKESAARISKMYCQEIFSGRYKEMPKITDFPNFTNYDGIYLSGPIPVRSVCAHHLQNISGNCWVGIFPGDKVVGLSKPNRIVEHICSRPQIQEEMSMQILDEIQKATGAKGVALVMKAEHHCVLARGVRAHDSDMTTSLVRGEFRENEKLKQEWLALLATMKGIKD